MDHDKIVLQIFNMLEAVANSTTKTTQLSGKTNNQETNVIYSLLALVIGLILTTLAKIVKLQSLTSQCCTSKKSSPNPEP